jgi:hypothetical protein
MERLLGIGFVRVGNWLLSENGETIDYQIDQHREKTNLLYVFAVHGEIKYIGKTTKKLFQRLGFYKTPGQSQSTNIRVNANIKAELIENQEVDIFVLIDNGLLLFGGYHINLAAGIEDALISAIEPPWNLRGISSIERIKDELVNDEPNNYEQQDLVLKDRALAPILTRVTLGQTYYTGGYFNIPTAQSNSIGTHNDLIEIQLNNGDVIIGHINRNANTNNTPKIIGGPKLRDWIQNNFALNDVIKIEILDPNYINLLLT